MEEKGRIYEKKTISGVEGVCIQKNNFLEYQHV